MALKIVVIGNAGAGKTTLSRRLAQIYNLPLIHTDHVQFDEQMQLRDPAQTRRSLKESQSSSSWIIDGYGPLDIIEERFLLSDHIIFMDWPLWRHYWWSTKRLLKNSLRGKINFSYTLKLYRTILKVHRGMRPELLRILKRSDLKEKVIYIRTISEWRQIYQNGIAKS